MFYFENFESECRIIITSPLHTFFDLKLYEMMKSLDICQAFTEYFAKYAKNMYQIRYISSKNLMELHKDFIPYVLFYCMHAFLCRTFIRKYYNRLLPRRTIFFIEQNLGDFFCMELQKKRSAPARLLWFCIFCIH